MCALINWNAWENKFQLLSADKSLIKMFVYAGIRNFPFFHHIFSISMLFQQLLQVSWVRHRDIHLLTVGRYTYTSDQRFKAIHHPHSEDWILQIKYPQHRDSGIYECQVRFTLGKNKNGRPDIAALGFACASVFHMQLCIDFILECSA